MRHQPFRGANAGRGVQKLLSTPQRIHRLNSHRQSLESREKRLTREDRLRFYMIHTYSVFLEILRFS